MSGMNRWQGIVRTGADAELRFTPGGKAVLGMRVACTEKYKSAAGEQKEQTIWLNANVWGPRAEALGKIGILKGTLMYIDGPLRIEEYDAKDGQKKTKVGIDVDKLELLGGKGGGAGDSGGHGAPANAQAPRTQGGGYGGGRPQAAATAAPTARDGGSGSGDYGGGAADYGGSGGGGGSDDDIPFLSSSMTHDMRRAGM